ncbi:hypothetical protein [Amycolatopsis sp. SID8362]|uniref:hypothetical protein n=1 Tax=Amycolatopsis sp. SID8362 TaxID=2690346 RepID=UPI001EF1DD7C|nr:hypothetical protein [Amycolatopsis sp. SID8362]
MADWTITASGDTATFTHVADGYWAPRVWSGRGLAIAEADLPALDKAVGAVLKLPIYWLARARHAAIWSAPRYDPDYELVYLTGPCRTGAPAPGYRPAPAFDVDLVHLRGLRIRIAAYRSASTGR